MTVDAFLLSKAKESVNAYTVLFVDESSMLGFDNAEALINLAREHGAKIIFQGDKEQLPSVSRGRFFANCIEKRLGTESAELSLPGSGKTGPKPPPMPPHLATLPPHWLCSTSTTLFIPRARI